LQNKLTEDILKILYASEEEKVAIDEEGNLTITPGEGGDNVEAGNDDED
jgi:hypothetical protein